MIYIVAVENVEGRKVRVPVSARTERKARKRAAKHMRTVEGGYWAATWVRRAPGRLS